jgi:hypothetical protein
MGTIFETNHAMLLDVGVRNENMTDILVVSSSEQTDSNHDSDMPTTES